MLLVIDVGNSNIVAGVYQDSELLVHWRFSTDRSKTADEYGILLSMKHGIEDHEESHASVACELKTFLHRKHLCGPATHASPP